LPIDAEFAIFPPMIKKTTKPTGARIQQLIYELKDQKHLNSGHKPIVDELETLAKKHNDRLALAKSVFFNAMIIENDRNIDDAIALYDKVAGLFEELQATEDEIEALNRLGWCIGFLRGDYLHGMKYLLKGLEMAKKINYQRGIATCSNSLAAIYAYQGDYPPALENLYRALKIMQHSGDKKGASHVLSNIGNIYQRQEDYTRSLDYHQQALKMREEVNDQLGIASSLNNMGICYDMTKDYDRALKSYHKARELYQKSGNLYGLISTLNNIGYVYTEQEKYEYAKKYLKKALTLGEEINNKHRVLETRNAIGIIIAKENKSSEAVKYMLKTLQMAEEAGAKPQTKEVLQELYKCEKQRANYADALKYYERMIILEKEIFNEETSRKISNLKMAADLDKKEKEAEIERLKNVELKKAYEIIETEKTKSENLLLNILPFEVAEELKELGITKARFFENVTVMFTDFKGFTSLSEKISPQELVDELHACFTAFDNIINKYKIEKIKTIGDSYMAVCGVPVSTKDHALKMVRAANDILQFMLSRQKKQKQKSLDIRIGIHSGSVVAGVVGKNKFAYDIWGDTVNVASRLEQHCEPGKINISLNTYQLIKNKFICTPRGKIKVKNKGDVEMFYLVE